jgi:hypothetical protein
MTGAVLDFVAKADGSPLNHLDVGKTPAQSHDDD